MVVSEFKLTVTKTINLGNYENVKIEGAVTVGKDSDDDTADDIRNRALDEVRLLVQEAEKDHLPKRRSQSIRDEN